MHILWESQSPSDTNHLTNFPTYQLQRIEKICLAQLRDSHALANFTTYHLHCNYAYSGEDRVHWEKHEDEETLFEKGFEQVVVLKLF